jgi:predicted  nucleic acid-binding Zn-ribbon protein
MEETLILKLRVSADPKNAKTINDLIKQNKELAKVIKDAPREGEKGYEELKDTLEDAKKQYAKNREEILKFNKELRTGEKQTEAAEDSLKGLSKQLRNLEKEYKALSREERNAARGKELQRSILRTRKELLKAEKAIGDFRRQVGNYTRTLVGLNSGFGSLVVSVGQLRTLIGGLPALFNSASTAAKLFLGALGPIAIIVTAITAALSRFQGVIDRVQNLIAGAGAAFDVLVERVGRAGLAFEKLRNFDFSGFADEVKNAFSGIGDEIQNDTAAAIELSERLQQVRNQEIEARSQLAQLEVDISEARRKSQEAELDNRALAIAELEKAIELTEQKAEIERRIAQDTEDALREQVNLSNETTRVEDLSKLADAEVKRIQINKQLNDELRGLQRRLVQLRKAENKNNTDSLKGLQALQKQQADLTKQLKDQILAGDDYTKTLQDLEQVTKQIIAVDETFKSLTEATTDEIKAQKGSIADINEQLNKQTEELEKLNPESEKYKELQESISQLEAQRDAITGDLTDSIKDLNAAQAESIAVLEDLETEIRLRDEAQQQLKQLEGTSKEVAEKRTEIEQKLQNDLRQIRLNRINDEQEGLQAELDAVDSNLKEQLEIYANNETKKDELLLQAQQQRDAIRQKELELEKEKLDISKQNFLDAEKEKTAAAAKEEQRRKQLRDLAVQTSVEAGKKILELLSVIQQQQTEEQLSEIQKREDAEIAEAELLGKTEAEKQKIREKFEAEREALERKAAQERKAIALAEATIDIASAVINALSTPPAPNAAAAAAAGALGAVQLAIIAATNFATGGLVQPVQLEDGKIINTPNIPQLSNGDNVLATVKVGEAVINQRQIAALGGSKAMALAGVPGFSTGGKVELNNVKNAKAFATGGYVPKFSNSIIKAKAMQSGGLVTPNQKIDIEGILKDQQQALLLGIENAVALGAAKGSQSGIENSDISNQIARNNERQSARNQRAAF